MEYEAGRYDWDVLQGEWYYTAYYHTDLATLEVSVRYWKPPWPGAPRELAGIVGLYPYNYDPQWVVDIGLELPPALVPHTLANPFPRGAEYEPDDVGFYPPLKPGVNVVWAAGVDVTDLSLRPECPEIARLEVLDTAWAWPTRDRAAAFSIHSYEEFRRQNGLGGGPDGWQRPIDQGDSMVWVEEEKRAYWRFTPSTPYGWYTFDIETLSPRPVDTAADSWDTLNIWGWDPDGKVGTLGRGSHYYNDIYGAFFLPPEIEPWPAFDPWAEVAMSRGVRTVPGPHILDHRYYEPRGQWLWSDPTGISAYMRVTCE